MRLLPFDYAVRNLGRSPLRLALSVGGSALVVLLVIAAGAFVRGMTRGLTSSGQTDNVILLGAGSEESLERSEIGASVGEIVRASVPGIKQRLGVAFVSPEVQMQSGVTLSAGDSRLLQLVMRGVEPAAFLVHPQVRITDGRAPEAGRDELMVGKLAARRMGVGDEQLAIGRHLFFDGRPWTIVGRFEAPGTVSEAEVWLPLRDLQIHARRDNLSCVVLTLDSAEYEDVDAFCKQRLDLELVAMRERDYYANLSAFYRPVRAMVWVTAGLIALGGLLGGLNTMYAAFASRTRELASLQAIGFSRRAIVVSLVQEAVLATAAGALVGSLVGMLVLDGAAVRFSMGAFGLVVDAQVIAGGLLTGVLLGAAGALAPAWRALRMPITEALKSA